MNLRHIDLLCFLKNKRQVSNNQLLVPSLPLKLKKRTLGILVNPSCHLSR